MGTAMVVAVTAKWHIIVNICKENIGSLQSTQCNEVWNRIKDKVNKVGLMKNLLMCKNKIRNSKEAF